MLVWIFESNDETENGSSMQSCKKMITIPQSLLVRDCINTENVDRWRAYEGACVKCFLPESNGKSSMKLVSVKSIESAPEGGVGLKETRLETD